MRRLEQDRAKRQNRHFRVRHAIVSRHDPSIGWKQEEGKKKYALWSKIPFSRGMCWAVALGGQIRSRIEARFSSHKGGRVMLQAVGVNFLSIKPVI